MTRRGISLPCCPKRPARHPNPPPRACTTHTPLVGRNCASEAVCSTICTRISTHTLLAGRDSRNRARYRPIRISTHTPLAGRDSHLSCSLLHFRYFYSHAPRGARRAADPAYNPSEDFYSHAPRGARQTQLTTRCQEYKFLLTRPSRGATVTVYPSQGMDEISTHTPLAGRD